MRRRSIALLGFVLAATLASPVIAGNAGTEGPVWGAADSPLPVPNEPWTDPCFVASVDGDGSWFIWTGSRTVRLPPFDSPLEAVLDGSTPANPCRLTVTG